MYAYVCIRETTNSRPIFSNLLFLSPNAPHVGQPNEDKSGEGGSLRAAGAAARGVDVEQDRDKGVAVAVGEPRPRDAEALEGEGEAGAAASLARALGGGDEAVGMEVVILG